MKIGLFLQGAALLSLLAFSRVAGAQEKKYYEEHRHSVTVSTGIPSLWGSIFPPGSMNNSLTMDGQKTGKGYRTWFTSNINIGYNCQLDRRLEVSLLITQCGHFYTEYTYPPSDNPQGEETWYGAGFDWEASPVSKTLHYQLSALIPSAMLRLYWLARKDWFQMYSAAGFGFVLGSSAPIGFTVTPLGVRFGPRHWYGVAELTVGTTATLLLAGAGYRF